MFLKLNEGFSEQERGALESRLEKYRSVVVALKSEPQKLRQKLDQLKPEIVRVIKKKRAANANKAGEANLENVSSSSRDTGNYHNCDQVQRPGASEI